MGYFNQSINIYFENVLIDIDIVVLMLVSSHFRDVGYRYTKILEYQGTWIRGVPRYLDTRGLEHELAKIVRPSREDRQFHLHLRRNICLVWAPLLLGLQKPKLILYSFSNLSCRAPESKYVLSTKNWALTYQWNIFNTILAVLGVWKRQFWCPKINVGITSSYLKIWTQQSKSIWSFLDDRTFWSNLPFDNFGRWALTLYWGVPLSWVVLCSSSCNVLRPHQLCHVFVMSSSWWSSLHNSPDESLHHPSPNSSSLLGVPDGDDDDHGDRVLGCGDDGDGDGNVSYEW